jgi:hypothetical protein
VTSTTRSSRPASACEARFRNPSYNWPPLSRRDVIGILVAIIGTLVLGALAAECVGDATGVNDLEEGRLGAACAATILIALAIALINLAHVVGLFLFQSVGYEGIFSRFFARLSLFGTPAAIAVGFCFSWRSRAASPLGSEPAAEKVLALLGQ